MVVRHTVDIPLDRIRLGENDRDVPTRDSLLGMSKSIQTVGVLHPVIVRRVGDEYELLVGMRRFLASQIAEKETIPARIVEGDYNRSQLLASRLVENIHRENLLDLDTANAIARFMEESGLSASQAAVELGLSTSSVSNLLTLLGASPIVKKFVASGEIAASTAVEIARAGDMETQNRLAEDAVEHGLSRDAVVASIKQSKNVGNSIPSERKSRVTAVLSAGRSVTVTCSGLTLDVFISCLSELLAKARRARPKGVTLTTFCKTLRQQVGNRVGPQR
ncbi:MAG: ParB/RepB/Spo0J family partition protein [Phycisphaerae bacterium]|nr:ParB/RepB/Spo0J family partition protein [Phycisphaerae bacterium]